MFGLIENNRFIKGSESTGVHLNILNNDRWKFNYVRLIRKKNDIRLVSGDEKTGDPVEVIRNIPAKIPVCLSIEGKGVIHRKVEVDDAISPVLQVFPNARPGDFYHQERRIDDTQTYVSLVRKSVLDDVLGFFRDHGVTVFKVTFGPFALNSMWSLLDNIEPEFCIENYCLHHSGSVINELKIMADPAEPAKLKLGNDSIDSSLLIPYAGALSFYLKEEVETRRGSYSSSSEREQYIYRRLCRLAGFGLLGTLFLVLSFNYLFFSVYSQRLNEAMLSYKAGIDQVDHFEQIENQLKIKKIIYQEAGLLNPTRFSYYADKIAARVPDQIMLTRIRMNPVSDNRGTDRAINVESNVIRITGMCLFSNVLDGWMEVLKDESWIKSIELLQYKQENPDSPAEFIVELELAS